MTDTLVPVKAYQQFIGGQWVDAASGQTLDVENPATGEVVGHRSGVGRGGRQPGRRGGIERPSSRGPLTTPQDA